MSSAQSEKGEVDWAEVYTKLLSHTTLTFEEIGKRTIPQLNAIGVRLDKHIEIKVGMPLFGGGGDTTQDKPSPDKEHSVSDGFAFAAMLNS